MINRISGRASVKRLGGDTSWFDDELDFALSSARDVSEETETPAERSRDVEGAEWTFYNFAPPTPAELALERMAARVAALELRDQRREEQLRKLIELLGASGIRVPQPRTTRGRASFEQQFLQLATEAAKENWDGYGAIAVSHEAIDTACELLSKLPLSTPDPDISVDPDGDVLLEWSRGPLATFTVAVSGDRNLSYAGLFGQARVHGVEPFAGSLPPAIAAGIQRTFVGGA